MIKPYFKDGILIEKSDSITPGFINALSMGFLRYMGDSRTTKTGMERPLSVLFSVDDDEKSKRVYSYFEESFQNFGIDYESAGNLGIEQLKKQFYDLDYDSGISIKAKKDEIEIEIFERGDNIGGLEAALPGGVNYQGKAISVDHALPIPQIAVSHIEHALNTETGLDILNNAKIES